MAAIAKATSDGVKKYSATALASMLTILEERASFVEGMIAQGKAPSPPQSAAFLMSLVRQLAPHVGEVSPRVVKAAQSALGRLGWDVGSNAPIKGTAPPSAASLQSAMADLVSSVRAVEAAEVAPCGDPKLRLASAKATAREVRGKIDDTVRELGFCVEELEAGDCSEKRGRALDKQRGRLETLLAALEKDAAAAAAMISAIEAALTPEQLDSVHKEALKERERERVAMAALIERSTLRPGAAAVDCHGKGGAGARGSGSGSGTLGTDTSSAGGGQQQYHGHHQFKHRRQEQQQQQQQKHRAAPFMQPSDGQIDIVASGDVRVKGHVLIDGRVCRVTDRSVSKTGKHGHAKLKLTAKDVETGKTTSLMLPERATRIEVPSRAWIDANQRHVYSAAN